MYHRPHQRLALESLLLEDAVQNPLTQHSYHSLDLRSLRQNRPHQMIDTPYGRIDTVRAGRSGAPQILLVPGTPDQIYTFHRLIALLAETHDVVAVSPPGKGFSTASDRFDASPDGMADFWRFIIRAFDLKNVLVLAHSSGVAELLHTIFRCGQDMLGIRGFISVCGWGPGVLPEKIIMTMADYALSLPIGPRLYRGFVRHPWFGLESYFPKLFARWMSDAHRSELLREYLCGWPKRDARTGRWDEGAIRAFCETVRQQVLLNHRVSQYWRDEASFRSGLRELPFLSVGASFDPFMRTASDRKSVVRDGVRIHFTDAAGLTYSDRLFRAFMKTAGEHPASRSLVIPRTGHMLPLEAAEELAAEVETFDAAIRGEDHLAAWLWTRKQTQEPVFIH